MVSRNRRQQAARVTLFLILALLLLFGALAGYHVWMRFQSTSDAALIAELQDATILEPALPVGPSDSPQWRGLQRDGVSPEKDLITGWPAAGPKVLWRADCGEGFSSVSVSNGKAITLYQNKDQNAEVVICWDADKGTELWRHEYACTYVNRNGNGPRATPTIDGDRVYTVGATGILNCLKVDTGKPVWSHDLLQEGRATLPQWGLSFSPLIEGDLVLTVPGGRDGHCIIAFDKNSGELRWHLHDDPAGYSSPIAITAGGVRQIVFFTGKTILGVAPADGSVYWKMPWSTGFDVNAATPIFFQTTTGDQTRDYVFISSGYGKGCALMKIVKEGKGFAVRSVYENKNMCNHFASSVRYKDYVYGFNDASLTCLDLRTGATAWQKSGFTKGSLILAGDLLVILGEHGQLALAEATPEEYREKDRNDRLFRNSLRSWTPPTLAHGKLYLRDEEKVLCLDVGKPD
jgi:outer membrane protein assembly factor BamB